jgi:hypothetical protein
MYEPAGDEPVMAVTGNVSDSEAQVEITCKYSSFF